MDAGDAIAGVSLLVSGLVAWFNLRDRRHAKFQIEAAHVTALLTWHGEVVETLARLLHVLEDAPSEKAGELAKLSSLIDRGRFFFPNIDKGDAYGEEKPPAFRGYRNLALDFLVAAYRLHADAQAHRNRQQAEDLGRYFTSIVFEVVRPEERLKAIQSITDRYFVQPKDFSHAIDAGNLDLIEFMWRQPRRRRPSASS